MCDATCLLASQYDILSFMNKDPSGDIDDIGWFTSLSIDSKEAPHISYYDYTNGALKYATIIGEDWAIQTVDDTVDVGRYISLALDNEGRPHISYYDYTNGDLKYASLLETGWDIETVDSLGNVGLYTSLALDSMGHPHIGYCDYTLRNVKYAYFNGDTWKKTVVDNTAMMCADDYFCDYISLDLDAYDRPHLSYCDYENFDLRYACLVDDQWQKEVVDSNGNVGVYSSLKLDDTGTPHICYADLTSSRFDLKYATKDDDGWNIDRVDQSGDIRKWISLALDDDQNPHISYYDYSKGSLEYTFYSDGEWLKQTIEEAGSTGCFNSLCVISDGSSFISFYDWGNKALKFSSEQGGIWETETIEIDTNTDFIDQEQKYCSGYASGIYSDKPFAQSFVPSYPVLTRVELMLVKRFNPGDFTLSIRENLDGEDLVSLRLGSVEIPEDISWKPFDFTDVSVQPGRPYYIVCSPDFTEEYNMYYWYFGHNDPYMIGDAWVFGNNGWEMLQISGFPDMDFGFKTFGLNTSIPDIPTITGPASGSVGVSYDYEVCADDVDGDELFYEIEWGLDDGQIIGPYPAGEIVELSHSWSKKGSYTISVKAVDVHGAESGWGSLEVTMPKRNEYDMVRQFLYFILGKIPIYSTSSIFIMNVR